MISCRIVSTCTCTCAFYNTPLKYYCDDPQNSCHGNIVIPSCKVPGTRSMLVLLVPVIQELWLLPKIVDSIIIKKYIYTVYQYQIFIIRELSHATVYNFPHALVHAPAQVLAPMYTTWYWQKKTPTCWNSIYFVQFMIIIKRRDFSTWQDSLLQENKLRE